MKFRVNKKNTQNTDTNGKMYLSIKESAAHKIDDMHRSFDETSDKLKATEKRIDEINILKKHIKKYQALRSIYAENKKSGNKEDFEHQHRREIILYEASYKYLLSVQNGGQLPNLESLNTELMELTEQKQELYADYRKSKKTLAEIDIIKANVDTIVKRLFRRKSENAVCFAL